ncbi:hypothetical protein BpHYR1_025054 [Brachionus plicatilis]|uniref:Uncharacterized protein n=1 Tax=Brachionus plicatilis TaxID=10195 RepID=A0A3M7SEB1_BRAPC|nr:hypothetical protein BpHYR1_025054 [Brachionus plicatilis]
MNASELFLSQPKRTSMEYQYFEYYKKHRSFEKKGYYLIQLLIQKYYYLFIYCLFVFCTELELLQNKNEEDTENDTEIEEIPVKKARKASRSYNHHADFETYNQALDMIKNKFVNMLKLCEFPGLDLNLEANKKRGRRKQATPALVQHQAESINNDIQTIVQPTTSSNLAPRKRGRPRKNP